RPVEDEDGPAPGRRTRDLDGVLDGLGARVHEQRLRRRLAREELVEALRHRDVRLVHADHEALVQVPVDLLVDGPDDRRVPVPEVLAGDPAGEVEVLVAVGVPELRAPRAGDDEIGRRDTARDVPLAVAPDGVGAGVLLDSHRGEYRIYGIRSKRPRSLRIA